MNFPNVRISRKIRTEQGTVIRIELLGSWFVHPGAASNLNSPKMAYILRTLASAQIEEPKMGWTLETQGTTGPWHHWSI